MEEVHIRRALPEDKQAVLQIHDNVYDGRDYLPSYYDYLMTAPNTTPYIALVGDSIVAFCVMVLLDDGQTVVTRAGRSSPKFAGRGIYQRLKNHMLAESGAVRNALTAADANKSITSPTFLQKHQLILSKRMQRYLFNPTDLQLPGDTSDVPLVTENDLGVLITTKRYQDYLFPHSRFIVDWVPFRLLASNVPMMFKTGADISAWSDVSFGENGGSGLLTVASRFDNAGIGYINYEIYGTDTSVLYKHLVTLFKSYTGASCSSTNMLVFSEDCVDKNCVSSAFQKIGLLENTWTVEKAGSKYSYSAQFLFENLILKDKHSDK